jgi:hypothetical protein
MLWHKGIMDERVLKTDKVFILFLKQKIKIKIIAPINPPKIPNPPPRRFKIWMGF